jgi:hypothetical protein
MSRSTAGCGHRDRATSRVSELSTDQSTKQQQEETLMTAKNWKPPAPTTTLAPITMTTILAARSHCAPASRRPGKPILGTSPKAAIATRTTSTSKTAATSAAPSRVIAPRARQRRPRRPTLRPKTLHRAQSPMVEHPRPLAKTAPATPPPPRGCLQRKPSGRTCRPRSSKRC